MADHKNSYALLHNKVHYSYQGHQETDREGDAGDNKVQRLAAAEITLLVLLGLHTETGGKYAAHNLGQGKIVRTLIRLVVFCRCCSLVHSDTTRVIYRSNMTALLQAPYAVYVERSRYRASFVLFWFYFVTI